MHLQINGKAKAPLHSVVPTPICRSTHFGINKVMNKLRASLPVGKSYFCKCMQIESSVFTKYYRLIPVGFSYKLTQFPLFKGNNMFFGQLYLFF